MANCGGYYKVLEKEIVDPWTYNYNWMSNPVYQQVNPSEMVKSSYRLYISGSKEGNLYMVDSSGNEILVNSNAPSSLTSALRTLCHS